MSESANGATEAGRNMRPAEVTVWDPFVRIFHWSVGLLFAIVWASQDWQVIHQPAGYAILALVGLRLLWGVFGSRHARFSDFIRPPDATLTYARALLRGRPPRSLGHNPLGGLMLLTLLGMLLATGASGWLMTTEPMNGSEWIEELHEGLASITLALVGMHVLGVIVMSALHGENLVRAMITGRKQRLQEPE